MEKKLTLVVCNFIVPEIAEVLHNGDYPDVELISHTATCNSVLKTKETLDRIIGGIDTNDIITINSNCLKCSKKQFTASKNLKTISLKQCFEPFVNSELIFHFISKGYFLATNGWLKSYQQHIKSWGFNKKEAAAFFGESMKKLLLLDTKIPGNYSSELETISEYMQLPYEVLPIGLDHCRFYIDSIVSGWRYEVEQNTLKKRLAAATKKSADYHVALSQLGQLVNLRHEEEVVRLAFNIINILFAPQSCRYIKNENGKNEAIYDTRLANNSTFNSSNSFRIELLDLDEKLGAFEVIGIGFPHFINQYKTMGNTIGELFSIAVANVRKFQIIVNQKAEIAEYVEQLKESNKTKDRFFSIVAHDLKGPMGSAHALSAYLFKEAKGSGLPDIERYASLVHHSLEETYNLLINLLGWAQSQLQRIEFNPENLQLYNLAEDVKSVFSTQLEKKRLSVSINIDQETKVYADKQMTTTILRNLISNAVKFSYEGGEIVLWTKDRSNGVEVFVKDFGVGMEEEVADKLFDLDAYKSETGTAGEKGTGLGLLLCKEFVEKQGGELHAESVINVGTTFRFTLAQSHV